MTSQKYALAAAFVVTIAGSLGSAKAEPGYTVEVFVSGNNVEAYCSDGCNLSCAGLAYELQAATFYSVEQGCVIGVSDGLALQQAMEIVTAFIESAGPNPQAGPPVGQSLPQNFLVTDENPNNNEVPVVTPMQ